MIFKRIFPLAFFLLVSLPHHPISNLLEKYLLIPYGMASVQAAVNAATAIAVVLTLGGIFVLKRKKLSFRAPIVAALAVTAVSIFLSDRILIVNNIERIHFIQYAILAVLLRLSLQNNTLVLLVSSFAGAVDEFLQYVMNPKPTPYLDFNDIALNILGAALGLFFFSMLRQTSTVSPSSYERRFRLVFVFIVSLALASVTFAVISGRVVSYSPRPEDAAPFTEQNGKLAFVLSSILQPTFWTTSEYGVRYHILSPAEGLILSTFLLLFFWAAFKWIEMRLESTR